MDVYIVTQNSEDSGTIVEGVFASAEGAIKHILGWADYIVEDAKEYGTSKEVVDEAIKTRKHIYRYYQNLNLNNFNRWEFCFAYGFCIQKTELKE